MTCDSGDTSEQQRVRLFEFDGPREARSQSKHGGEHDSRPVPFKPQALLQPLPVLCHVEFSLLGGGGDAGHQLAVFDGLPLGAHEHLPQLLQTPLHFPDDTLPLLHL